ncbi:hypothetical protein L484_016947 [Morus notabilis]|uniref:Transmembrane protein n=1 Tax=Morus notabilis TaxID=981085 RepID=W9QN73_9ROSA|nr:uncharacterized protein LOC21399971 [Morus notabilis]EXB36696.1 hypothetical protein L484_016947 [Morus notabilis]
MEQRKGDVRVYIVSGFFFSCIVSGGVFLGLYMFLPETQSSAWYPIAGMILVSVPWAFWFFTFLYRCFKPDHPPPQFDGSTRDPLTANGSPMTNPMASESPNGESPGGGGERRVQFGPAVVLGGQGEGHAGAATTRDHHEQEANEASNCSRESKMPLRLSI